MNIALTYAVTIGIDIATLYVLLFRLLPLAAGALERVLIALCLLLVGLRELALWAQLFPATGAPDWLLSLLRDGHGLYASLLLLLAIEAIIRVRRRLIKARDDAAIADQRLSESTQQLEARVNARTAELDEERLRLQVAQSTTKALYDEQNTQLELAAKLQSATMIMCRDTPPWRFASWFEPANRISGDVLRAEVTAGGATRVFIGDAMGHSVASAMLTMLVSASLEQIELELSPAEALTRMNAAMNAHNTGMYVTGQLVYATPDGRLSLSNAGHPPAILLRHNGEVELLGQEGGFALGMFGVQLSSYTESSVQLAAGDALVLTTDGISELLMDNGERLGDAGLMRLLREIGAAVRSPDGIVDELRGRLENRWLQSSERDDIAALVLAWNGGG